jgi:hypothetical protein
MSPSASSAARSWGPKPTRAAFKVGYHGTVVGWAAHRWPFSKSLKLAAYRMHGIVDLLTQWLI